MFLRPAEYVIHCFKGVRAAAREINRSPAAVSKWVSRDRGRVPGLAMASILTSAKRLGLDIQPNDLIYGKKIKR